MNNSTVNLANRLRKKVFDSENRMFLLSKISNSIQSNDLSTPCNCEGFGRIHHFHRQLDPTWISDPLPIDPACHALGIADVDLIETQVFQLSACNVHCWYCFVPDTLKCADEKLSKWFSAEDMVKLFLEDAGGARILDLSGGNPELAPEWILDTMKALERLGKIDDIYLWSDDTLTTDFLFEMDKKDIQYMVSYSNYGKVGCFKGFDTNSFTFNSGLDEAMFDKQFIRFEKYIDLGFDMYGYVTLTCSDIENIDERINKFADKLQSIHPLLPLRTIPLKIFEFSPTKTRMNSEYQNALINQEIAIVAWKRMLQDRFCESDLKKKIFELKMN